MQKVALTNLNTVAQEILSRVSPKEESAATLVLLRGDLGAGKTTLVQALARELGIIEVLQSPTYVLMKSYPIPSSREGNQFKTLVHIDAYRLLEPSEFKTIHPETFLKERSNLVVLEWPERAKGELPQGDLEVHLSSKDTLAHERYVEIV